MLRVKAIVTHVFILGVAAASQTYADVDHQFYLTIYEEKLIFLFSLKIRQINKTYIQTNLVTYLLLPRSQ